jgi:hypothetical protein
VAARALAARLATLATEGEGRSGGLLIAEIDGERADDHPLAPFLKDAGFISSAMGMQFPRGAAAASAPPSRPDVHPASDGRLARARAPRRRTSSPWSAVAPIGADEDPDA